jgi:hypothetical protein
VTPWGIHVLTQSCHPAAVNFPHFLKSLKAEYKYVQGLAIELAEPNIFKFEPAPLKNISIFGV